MRTIATSKLEQPFNQIEIGKYIPYIVIFFSIDNYLKKKENIKYSTLHNLIDILVTDSSDSRLNELDDNSKKLGLFF